MTVHFIGAGPGRCGPHHRARPRLWRAARCASMRARWCRARCWPVARRARASSTPRRSTSTRSSRRSRRPMSRAWTSRGCIPATSRSGARSANSCAGSTRSAFPITLTPGVPSFAAAAASLGRELTLPEVAQSVVLTRTSGRASAMPPKETLADFAATGATLAIHLSIHALDKVVAELDAALRRRIARSPSCSAPPGRTSACSPHARQHRGAGESRSRWSARR